MLYILLDSIHSYGSINNGSNEILIYTSSKFMNMIKQMTIDEKNRLRTGNFTELWKNLWGGEKISNQYKSEENTSREKYNALKSGIMIKSKLCTLRKSF